MSARTHRLFNFICALFGLLVLAPVFAFLAAAVKLYDGGPVFFRGKRVGMHGKEFSVLKFRSMKVGADKMGCGLTAHGDSRITPLGRFLRKTKLDELPQLWNVLVGQMNLVGPRPEDPRYVSVYSSNQRSILDFRPGITSPASIEFRNEEELLPDLVTEQYYLTHLLPRKLDLDMKYCSHQSIHGDIRLIFKTLAAIQRA